MKRQVLALITVFLSVYLGTSCSDESNKAEGVLKYADSSGWDCDAFESDCQDVYRIYLYEGSIANFSVFNVSPSSVAQIALYAPEDSLGGINLFTGNHAELRCSMSESCDVGQGESIESFTINKSGLYLFAITRNWGESCSSTGTYHFQITSDKEFIFKGQTEDDQKSKATGTDCSFM